MSSRSHSEDNRSAAARIDLKDARSNGMYLMSTGEERFALMEAIASWALGSLRAARYMTDGR